MSQQDDIKNEEQLGTLAMNLSNALVLPMVLKSAIKLNLIDVITSNVDENGTRSFLSSVEIATMLQKNNHNTSPVVLDRILSFLCSYDILVCSLVTRKNGEVERVYGAGAICKFFVRNKCEEGASLAPLAMLLNDEIFIKSWEYLDGDLVGGKSPFEKAHGMNAFEYMGKDERFNKVFNEAMSGHSALILSKILQIYKGFEGINVLVDVGGGIGSTLAKIIAKYPHIKGINFDLPHVLLNAPSYTGVNHVSGDMFTSIPKGDAIFLKWILHDWSDEDCIKFLKNCRDALSKNGKVIIVDLILPSKSNNTVTCRFGFGFDMLMLAQCPNGKERNLKEFKTLAMKSGFVDCKLIFSVLGYSVIEFHT